VEDVVDAHAERKTGIPLVGIIVFVFMLAAGAATFFHLLAQ
jgi:hypothetical protein